MVSSYTSVGEVKAIASGFKSLISTFGNIWTWDCQTILLLLDFKATQCLLYFKHNWIWSTLNIQNLWTGTIACDSCHPPAVSSYTRFKVKGHAMRSSKLSLTSKKKYENLVFNCNVCLCNWSYSLVKTPSKLTLRFQKYHHFSAAQNHQIHYLIVLAIIYCI